MRKREDIGTWKTNGFVDLFSYSARALLGVCVCVCVCTHGKLFSMPSVLFRLSLALAALLLPLDRDDRPTDCLPRILFPGANNFLDCTTILSPSCFPSRCNTHVCIGVYMYYNVVFLAKTHCGRRRKVKFSLASQFHAFVDGFYMSGGHCL